MYDLIAEFEQARRAVADTQLHGATGHVVEIRRTLRGSVADVWSACTEAERVGRWFLPLSGDLRPGGRFQLEGHAGGDIVVCEPPHRLQLTWEAGKLAPNLVTLELTPVGEDSTEFVLRHAVPDDDHWAQYGPGAVGVGWELALVGLATFTAGGAVPEAAEVMADPDTTVFMRRCAVAWGVADEAGGTDPETARAAATRTSDAYAPET